MPNGGPMRAYDLYVALGDSMSSDDFPGPGQGAASLLYRNRDELFPEFRGQDLVSLNPHARLLNATRDGATSTDILGEMPELLPPHGGPTLATVTLGGNDMIDAVNRRLTPERALADLAERLDRLLALVRSLYPHLTLRLGTIYDPTDGTGRVQSGHDRFAVALPLLGRVNALLEEVARRHGGQAVDVHGHFLGHGLRHRDPAYERYRADDPTGWITRDIEPNPRGASEIRRLFWRSLP